MLTDHSFKHSGVTFSYDLFWLDIRIVHLWAPGPFAGGQSIGAPFEALVAFVDHIRAQEAGHEEPPDV